MSGGVGTITGEDGSSYNLITEDILVNTKQIEGRGLVGHKVFFIPDGAQAKRVIVRDDILGIYIVAADGSFIGNGDRAHISHHCSTTRTWELNSIWDTNPKESSCFWLARWDGC